MANPSLRRDLVVILSPNNGATLWHSAHLATFTFFTGDAPWKTVTLTATREALKFDLEGTCRMLVDAAALILEVL